MSEKLNSNLLAILLENRSISPYDYEKFRNKLMHCIESLNIPDDIDEESIERLRDRFRRSVSKGGINIGMNLSEVLTSSIVQANLNTIHSIGKGDEEVNIGKVTTLDYINPTSKSSENTVIKLKISNAISYDQLHYIGIDLVGIRALNIIKEIVVTPLDVPESLKKHSYVTNFVKVIFDKRQLKKYDLSFNTVFKQFSNFYSKSSRKSEVFKSKVINDNNVVTKVLYIDFSSRIDGKIEFDIKKEIENILIRGDPNIKDIVYQIKDELEVYAIIRESTSIKKSIMYGNIIRRLMESPYIISILNINHGKVFYRYFGIYETFVKLLSMKEDFGFKEIYVQILAYLLTITGEIETIKSADRSITDKLSKVLKGSSLKKMIETIFSTTDQDIPLNSNTYSNIFGVPRNGKKISKKYNEIHSTLFNNTTIIEEKMKIVDLLYMDYDYS